MTIALARGVDTPLTYGVIQDISYAGARVVSDTAPPLGQWVGVALSFPRQIQIFQTRCRIVWLRPGSMVHWGVQFEPASSQVGEELRALIEGVSATAGGAH